MFGGGYNCESVSDKSAEKCFYLEAEFSSIPENADCNTVLTTTGETGKSCVIPAVKPQPPPQQDPVSVIWQFAANGANKFLEKHNIPLQIETVPDAGPGEEDAGVGETATSPSPPPAAGVSSKGGEAGAVKAQPGTFNESDRKIFSEKIVANVYLGPDGKPYVDTDHIEAQFESHGVTDPAEKAKWVSHMKNTAMKKALPGQSVEWSVEGRHLGMPQVKGEPALTDPCESVAVAPSKSGVAEKPAAKPASKPTPKYAGKKKGKKSPKIESDPNTKSYGNVKVGSERLDLFG